MTASQQAKLRVSINQIDYNLITPASLDNTSLPRAPVIRIYGSSSAGTNACVHVHQVYPYFFVEYPCKLHPKEVKRYVSKLTRSLNHAIAVSLKRNPQSLKSRYVRAVVLVKGIHFYGFHSSYSPFLKIHIVDPAMVSRAVVILQSGTVMSRRFHVFESHLSYTLQFMCDFGLYGCGYIELEDALQRCAEEEELDQEMRTANSITFAVSPYFRQSRMPLEVDVVAPQILNRHRLCARNIQQKRETQAPVPQSEPLVLGVRELWEDERNRRQELGLPPSPEIPVDPSDSSRGPGGEWIAEARWWEEIQKRIEEEQPSADNLQKSESNWERYTMTTFESAEALWEEGYRNWKPEATSETHPEDETDRDASAWNEDIELADDNQEHIEVDLSLLASEDISQLDEVDQGERSKNRADEQPMVAGDEDDLDLHEGEPAEAEEEELIEITQPVELLSDQDPFLPSPEDIGASRSTEFRLHSPPHLDHLDEPITPTKTSKTTGHSTLMGSPAALPLQVEFIIDTEDVEIRPLKKRKVEIAADLLENSLNTSGNSPLPFSPASPRAATRHSLIAARAVQLSRVFTHCNSTNLNRYVYTVAPPSVSELQESLESLDIPIKIYRSAYYSKNSDAPGKPQEYAGLRYHLKGREGISGLEEWDTGSETKAVVASDQFDPDGIGGWEYASTPPSAKEVRKWLHHECVLLQETRRNIKSQIEGPTPLNKYGFKTSGDDSDSKSRIKQNMLVLSLEVFGMHELFIDVNEILILTTSVPDAEMDEIVAVFYSHHTSGSQAIHSGVIVVEGPELAPRRIRNINMETVVDEIDLLNRIIDLVTDIDPDILVGWEVQKSSWGYLDARGKYHGFNVGELMSRAPPSHTAGADQWNMRNNSTFKAAGRHVLNLWRIMRSEQTLTSYSFENIAFNVLRQRVPKYTFKTLTEWFHSPMSARTAMLLQYFIQRTVMNLNILEETEVVTKTAEFARVFGVDFFSVISRGSQFKVESFMFRIAKPESFVLISPSKHDVGKQNAAECMPLIMEPISAYYSSPLVVLDFQSLYPSIMIAYNYCYSTCLGRIADFQGSYKLGVVDLDLPPGLLSTLHEQINVAPNGIMYVKPAVRKGLLGRMLVELLETRVMVKQAMKGIKNDKALKRILNARQLGLKYIANVTYGYTGATYSGRMPAVEIADSIAIDLINTTKKWGAQVVYGDTDSVFVYLKGRTKEQAFRIGNDIADTITALNPRPVKLKFEKVYLPCVLMAKKRYVGFKYENIDDKEPIFDAKGIETVRRDGVLAQRKMTENTIKILFRTQDLSEIKRYCCDSWTKILENKASIQDFIFAKEVRMGTYSDNVPPPPGVMVAARRIAIDPNYEPQYGERVPYVIVRGEPGTKLVERAIDPLELLNDSQLNLDATYYITKVLIPPLERIFNLVGANVRQWFNEMPRTVRGDPSSPRKEVEDEMETFERIDINGHFGSVYCLVCGKSAPEVTRKELCYDCWFSMQDSIANIGLQLNGKERRLRNTHLICASCTGSAPAEPIQCDSLDCPWLYARKKAEAKLEISSLLHEISEDLSRQLEEGIEEKGDSDGEDLMEDDWKPDVQVGPGESEDDDMTYSP
ncbi:hypothetical protein BDQ12DRAFT_697053 [Crucibulum laeve]|uniref:DNA polymerase n=1 Tax=Crucibulum laeve TaxID=68775 RepID=A0A5C3MBG5_9AGAR|nr:hypothetical protein BDQ12DRAFT_697053 [Crucibulum laeve]